MALLGGALFSEIILFVLIAIVLFIIFKVGKTILKLIFGIIANSILGILSIYLLDYFFGLGIPLALYTLVPTAIFGLPAVGTFVILKLLGAGIVA
jgi:hypothetical protein